MLTEAGPTLNIYAKTRVIAGVNSILTPGIAMVTHEGQRHQRGCSHGSRMTQAERQVRVACKTGLAVSTKLIGLVTLIKPMPLQ